MTKVYTLTGISTGTEATEKFFNNNKFFFVKRLNNGHFSFVGSNREVLETSTCQHFAKDKDGNIVISTRNSNIRIAPVINDDKDCCKINPRSGYGTADVQYLKGLTAGEIAEKFAYAAIKSGYRLLTFRNVHNDKRSTLIMLTLRRGEFFDNNYKFISVMVDINNYEVIGKDAVIRIAGNNFSKKISLAGSPNQINKKIKAILA